MQDYSQRLKEKYPDQAQRLALDAFSKCFEIGEVGMAYVENCSVFPQELQKKAEYLFTRTSLEKTHEQYINILKTKGSEQARAFMVGADLEFQQGVRQDVEANLTDLIDHLSGQMDDNAKWTIERLQSSLEIVNSNPKAMLLDYGVKIAGIIEAGAFESLSIHRGIGESLREAIKQEYCLNEYGQEQAGVINLPNHELNALGFLQDVINTVQNEYAQLKFTGYTTDSMLESLEAKIKEAEQERNWEKVDRLRRDFDELEKSSVSTSYVGFKIEGDDRQAIVRAVSELENLAWKHMGIRDHKNGIPPDVNQKILSRAFPNHLFVFEDPIKRKYSKGIGARYPDLN